MSRHGVLDPSYPHKMFQVQHEAVRQLLEHIKEFPEPNELDRSDDRYLVNYVTALLGQRGAGKTTVMHELRKKLLGSYSERKWLVTEILVPDVLHSRDSIGPAIFDAVFQALLEAANGDETNQQFVQARLGELRSNLSWFYNPFVPNDIIARDSVSASNFARSVFEYHIKAKNLHVEFSQAIEACVRHIGFKKIVVMIDDADINIDLVGRILDVIRYALSSPRIVTVFSSDYATLRRRLFNERLENLHIDKLPDKEVTFFGSTSEAFKAREVEAERDYVDAYLAKILPPSTRVSLQPMRARDLLHHEIRLGGPNDKLETISSLLAQVGLEFTATSETILMSALVARYPNVLAVNLRGWVNQASQAAYIIEKYKAKDFLFFEVDSSSSETNLAGGLLQMSATLSKIDEAVLIRLIRLFFSSPNHSDWLEGLSYFGILDLERESSLSRILEAIVTRATVRGSAIDSFILEVSDAAGNKISYKKKAEVHPIHLIIDLAVIFGANLESVMRTLGYTHNEAFRTLYLSPNMLEFMLEHQNGLSRNVSVIVGSGTSGIAGLIEAGRGTEATSPFFTSTSGDVATHMHRTTSNRSAKRIMDANEALRAALRRKNSDEEKDAPADEQAKLDAETNQLYVVLYSMMDTCVNQLRSAYGAVFDVPATDLPGAELTFTTNVSYSWGIINSLDGWRFLNRLLSSSDLESTSQWDKPLMVLLYLAQMPYEPMIACFAAATRSAREDRKTVRALLKELYSFLRDHALVTEDRKWQSDEQFRQSVAALGDLPKLRTAVAYWPNAAWNERGQSLLDFLDFIGRDGIDLNPEVNLQISPPPRWKDWVERFIEVSRAVGNNEAIEKGE